MQFVRLIKQGPEHAFFNMALDEAISEAVRQKESPPTLRLYEWDRPSVSLGYFQKASDINTGYCADNDYPVVRRLTGGRAILHDAELTYSFSSSADCVLFNGSLMDSYKTISAALVRTLQLTGLDAAMSFDRKRGEGPRNPACFKAVSYGEVTVDSRKIIGSAQKRYRDGFLQHGSILMSFNADKLCSVLINSSKEEFVSIGSIDRCNKKVTIDVLKNFAKQAFEAKLNIRLISDSPSKSEMNLAKELERNKYSKPEWNCSR
jgi:lipoate-protein ligase A